MKKVVFLFPVIIVVVTLIRFLYFVQEQGYNESFFEKLWHNYNNQNIDYFQYLIEDTYLWLFGSLVLSGILFFWKNILEFLKTLESDILAAKNKKPLFVSPQTTPSQVPSQVVGEDTNNGSKKDLPSLYKILNDKLNDEKMTLFCQLYFEEVHNNLGLGQTKTAKISALLDYAKRNNLLEKLEKDLGEFLA